ncbi:MAG TPA: heat shock protein HspQ, partial [Pseudomonadales bacterium]|nr:heat shock protein HspQ [Pseudomonadales bacterium]
HLKFGYRGVVFSVDPTFALDDDWYEQVATSRPPKDAPWYHVLVDGTEQTTYVAERHLEASADTEQVEHPLLGEVFDSYDGQRYYSRTLH